MKKILIISIVLTTLIFTGCGQDDSFAGLIGYDRMTPVSPSGIASLDLIYGKRGMSGDNHYMIRFYYGDESYELESMKFMVDAATIIEGKEYYDDPGEHFDISSSQESTILNGSEMRIEWERSGGTYVCILTAENIADVKEFFTGYSVGTIAAPAYEEL